MAATSKDGIPRARATTTSSEAIADQTRRKRIGWNWQCLEMQISIIAIVKRRDSEHNGDGIALIYKYASLQFSGRPFPHKSDVQHAAHLVVGVIYLVADC